MPHSTYRTHPDFWASAPERSTTMPESLTYDDVKRRLAGETDLLVNTVAHLLVDLGSKEEWDMDLNRETTETIALLAAKIGLPSATDQAEEQLAVWRRIADAVGIDHDGPEVDDEDDEDDEPQVGDRATCLHCQLDIEWNGDDWWDRGGNTTGSNGHTHEPYTQD